jgi:hypothetical protein
MLGHSEVMETCQYNKYWSHLYNKRFVTTAATTIVPSIMRLFFFADAETFHDIPVLHIKPDPSSIFRFYESVSQHKLMLM